MDAQSLHALADRSFAGREFSELQEALREGRAMPRLVLSGAPVLADPALMAWELDRGACTFMFGQAIATHPFRATLAKNWAWCVPLLLAFARHHPAVVGRVHLSLGDMGTAPGLVFCDNRTEGFHCIPDPLFLGTDAYAVTRANMQRHSLPWVLRRPAAFWRGSANGWHAADGTETGSWRQLPRVALARLARTLPEGMLDAALTTAAPFGGEDAACMAAEGLLGAFVPPAHLTRYRMHIDIDGNTNSWTGLFLKLASGSPVLKVASAGGFRQWYYGRLVPWRNYIPVRADLADLPEAIGWVLSHPEEAQAIGEQGQALAGGMTVEAEVRGAFDSISGGLCPHPLGPAAPDPIT